LTQNIFCDIIHKDSKYSINHVIAREFPRWSLRAESEVPKGSLWDNLARDKLRNLKK